MDILILGIFFVIAVAYLYYANFKKKGCNCGCKSCESHQETACCDKHTVTGKQAPLETKPLKYMPNDK